MKKKLIDMLWGDKEEFVLLFSPPKEKKPVKRVKNEKNKK